jgi:hypothetical protein
MLTHYVISDVTKLLLLLYRVKLDFYFKKFLVLINDKVGVFGLNIWIKMLSFRSRPKHIFRPLFCSVMNTVQQSTTVKLSITPWQHSGLLRKFLTAHIFSKL